MVWLAEILKGLLPHDLCIGHPILYLASTHWPPNIISNSLALCLDFVFNVIALLGTFNQGLLGPFSVIVKLRTL